MEYANLEQLVIGRYIATMADFRAVGSAEADEVAQRAFYQFITKIYASLHTDPGILFSSFHEADIYHNRYNMSSENKPELYGLIKRIMTAVDGFFEVLRTLPDSSMIDGNLMKIPKEVKLKKSHIKLLEAVGIVVTVTKSEYSLCLGEYLPMLSAWRWLARRTDISQFLFARCVFTSPEVYAHDIFRVNLGNSAAFDKLIGFLQDNGYECTTMRDGELTLDYAKDYGKKPTPLKTGWAERDHAGIECKYYPVIDKAFAITLRIPRNTELLKMLDSMPVNVKEFVLRQNPKCNNCRYCVQTDKTGKRPLACIPAEHDGKKYALCPRFPGFHFTWDYIDDQLVDEMTAYLEFIDSTISRI